MNTRFATETVFVPSIDDDAVVTDCMLLSCGAMLYEVSTLIPGCGWVPLADWLFADEFSRYSPNGPAK